MKWLFVFLGLTQAFVSRFILLQVINGNISYNVTENFMNSHQNFLNSIKAKLIWVQM